MDSFIRNATPPKDKEVSAFLETLTFKKVVSFLNDGPRFFEFYEAFKVWASKSQKIKFDFSESWHPLFANGTTQAFNNFYLEHENKKLILLKGEYPYHRDVFGSLGRPFYWYGDCEIDSHSMLIISTPFSATGNFESDIFEILRLCEQRNACVMLDMAFAGLGGSVDYSELAEFSCVKQMSFSFSKMFNMGKFRVGITWMRDPRGPVKVLNQWNYLNWLGAYVIGELITRFSFDYMSNKYRPKQVRICENYGLTPSQSYLFGIGGREYDFFSRDGGPNRVCLSPLFGL